MCHDCDRISRSIEQKKHRATVCRTLVRQSVAQCSVTPMVSGETRLFRVHNQGRCRTSAGPDQQRQSIRCDHLNLYSTGQLLLGPYVPDRIIQPGMTRACMEIRLQPQTPPHQGPSLINQRAAPRGPSEPLRQTKPGHKAKGNKGKKTE